MYLSIDIVLTIQKFQFRLTCSALILSCHIEYRVLNFSLKTGMKIVICVQLVNKFHICWKPLKPFDVLYCQQMTQDDLDIESKLATCIIRFC